MRRTAAGAAFAASVLVAGLFAGTASAADPGTAKRLAWQQLLHKGTNAQARSVAIHDGMVTAVGFTTSDLDSPRLTVRTYDLATGKQVWHDQLNGVSIAQQVSAAEGVVAVGGFTLTNGQSSGYQLRVYDGKSGKLLWNDAREGSKDNQSHYQAVTVSGGRVYAAGYVGSCAFYGEPGCSAAVRAYDAKTGKLAWEAQAGLPTGFSAFTALSVVDGMLYAVGGTSPLLRLYESGLLVQAFDAASGALKWQAPVSTSDGRSAYEVATSVAVGNGIVAVGGRTGSLGVTDWAVRAFDVTNGLPKWSDEVPGGLKKADSVNGIAFAGNRMVAVGVSAGDAKAQRYLVRAYDPASGAVAWTDSIASAEKKIAQASELDDYTNQLESALSVVTTGSKAYVTGRVGANCDGTSPGNCDLIVRAYDGATGKHAWTDRFDRAGHDDVGQAAAISGSRLVVSGRSTSTNKYGFQSFWIVRAYKL
jgi:outer membrane protein assembly factor BamB